MAVADANGASDKKEEVKLAIDKFFRPMPSEYRASYEAISRVIFPILGYSEGVLAPAPVVGAPAASPRELALLKAACNQDIDRVKSLIEEGVSVDAANRFGNTVLMVAIGGRHEDIVKLLIANGANVNVFNNYKTTPLIYASELGCLDIVNLLIEAGADVNMTGKESLTALGWAKRYEFYDVIEALETAGAVE